MLAVSWIYMVHNLSVTYISLGILKQLFYIRTSHKMTLSYMVWMQVVFIFNDFAIEANFPLEYKYITIFVGFTLAFIFILKLSIIGSSLVMVINLTINGVATNMNIFTLLLNQFESYGLALESDFIQYTSLVMVTSMIFMVLKTFNIRVLDVTKYN